MERKNSIILSGDKADVSVSVFLFKDGGAYVAYCPSLDISGYDTTEESAMEDFRYMLCEWLKEQLSNGTLQQDLAGHGWKVGGDVATEPSFADLMRRNRSTGRILSMPEYRKTNVRTGIFCR